MEEWKDIKGYEGLYQVSNEGNVKSVDRIVVANSRWGSAREMLFKGRMIKQSSTSSGYLKVQLSKNGVVSNKDVHRIVYEAFNGTIPDGMQVNHKDECKTNNKLENLELLTPKENSNYGTGIERMKQSKKKRLGKNPNPLHLSA